MVEISKTKFQLIVKHVQNADMGLAGTRGSLYSKTEDSPTHGRENCFTLY